jgi:hypothetical protein
MEPDQITSRDKNPLNSLTTAQSRSNKAIAKAPERHFPLMNLLPELRIRIYGCVLADLADSLTPPSLSTVQNLDDHLRPRLRGCLALLHAGRALRSEALDVYCLAVKARLATLKQAIQSMYAAIDVLGKVPDWKMLMEALARELVLSRLGFLLRVIKFVMNDGEEKRGWSFAALKTAMTVDDADRVGCD